MLLKDIPKGAWSVEDWQVPVSVTRFAQIGFCEMIPLLERLGVHGRVTKGMRYGLAWHAKKERAEKERIKKGVEKIISKEQAETLLKAGSEVKIARESVRLSLAYKSLLVRGRLDHACLLPGGGFVIQEDKTVSNDSDRMLKKQYLLQVLAYARGFSNLLDVSEGKGICRLNYFFEDGSSRTDEFRLRKKEAKVLDRSLERFHQIYEGGKAEACASKEKCRFCRFSHACKDKI